MEQPSTLTAFMTSAAPGTSPAATVAVACARQLGDIGDVSDETKSSAPPESEPNALSCPTCGGAVDPRRTTQALSRNGKLLLFCSSGCTRQFLATEREQKG